MCVEVEVVKYILQRYITLSQHAELAENHALHKDN